MVLIMPCPFNYVLGDHPNENIHLIFGKFELYLIQNITGGKLGSDKKVYGKNWDFKN